MSDRGARAQALTYAVSRLQVHSDQQLFKIRKSLILVASISFISLFIQPLSSHGYYELNIGIIKGTITNPEYIYFSLLIANLYFLCFFIDHCKVLRFKQYNSISDVIYKKFATDSAVSELRPLLGQYLNKNGQMPIFQTSNRRDRYMQLHAPLHEKTATKYRQELAGVESNDRITVHRSPDNDIASFSYTYNFDDDDYKFVQVFFKSACKVVKSHNRFVVQLPVAFSLVTILLLGLNIFHLINPISEFAVHGYQFLTHTIEDVFRSYLV